MVTGASGGIGEVTARALALRGAQVVMVCRNAERARSSQINIAAAAGGLPPQIVLADLSDLSAVQRAALEIRTTYPAIHILVNNAGFMGYPSRTFSVDGLESTMATNYLGPYALTMGIIGCLKQAGPGTRIVNVSSVAHRLPQARFSLDDLNFERGYSAFAAYSRSKLMNVLFTRELATRLVASGITANSLHPGVVYTGIARTYPSWFQTLHKVGRLFMISPEKGAETSIYLATSPQVRQISGEYFARCKRATSARWSGEPVLRAGLWQRSAELLGASPDWC